MFNRRKNVALAGNGMQIKNRATYMQSLNINHNNKIKTI